MRIAMGFWLVCVTACAANKPPPVAASLPQVDPLAEVIAIPPGTCLGLDDHFALSTNAVRHLLVNMAETDNRHAVELAKCSGRARAAETRARVAEEAAEEGEMWRRWGPIVGASIGLIVGAAVPSALLFLTR